MTDVRDMRCIWCGELSGAEAPPEHIVPEAIGCPEGFVLSHGEVCSRCNHGLAHLDQALVADLEVYAVWAGVKRKKNRPGKVSSYGNFRAENRNGHVMTHFNMGSDAVVAADGKHLAPYRGKERDVVATMTRTGNLADIEFDIPFGKSPKVARALVKMAAEYFCFELGAEKTRTLIKGAVTEFVREGMGERPILICGGDKTKYEHHFGRIGTIGVNTVCAFRLAHMEIVVDLGPDQSAFDKLAEAAYATYGRTGWTTLPPSAFVR